MTAGSYTLYVAPVHPYSLDNFREKFIFVLQFSHPQTKSSFGRLHVLKLHLCNHIGTGYMNVCHELIINFPLNHVKPGSRKIFSAPY